MVCNAQLTDEWPRWWLLTAAEAWAALHPDAFERIYPLLEKIMVEDHFTSRLQAWLILCKLADKKGTERPAFPMKAPAGSQPSYVRRSGGGIFDIGPQTRGIIHDRMEVNHMHPIGPEFQHPRDQAENSNQESRTLRVTDQTINSKPMTVRAVIPNVLGSPSSAPRIIPLRVKAIEPMTQRSSIVIVENSFIVGKLPRSRPPNE
jgi:hypothetical protein